MSVVFEFQMFQFNEMRVNHQQMKMTFILHLCTLLCACSIPVAPQDAVSSSLTKSPALDPSATKTTTAKEKIAEDEMLHWLRNIIPSIDQNVSISSFAIEGDPLNGTRRGLKAKINLERGDTIITLPRKLFMSRSTAFESPIGDLLYELKDVLSDKWILTLHLLYEWYNKHSIFKHYLSTIPKPNTISSTNVLFWTEHDINLLQCNNDLQCQIGDRIKKEQKLTRTMYNEIKPLMITMFPENAFTYNNFAWSYGTVKSRCFTVNITSTYGTNFLNNNNNNKYNIKPGLLSILVPFGDLFNHHNSNPPLQHGAYEFNDELDALVVKADEKYNINDEVFISYGILTNPDLLMSYGFIMLDNSFETVGFRLSVDMSSSKSNEMTYENHLTPMHDIRHDLYTKSGLLKKDDTSQDKILETHIGLDGRTSSSFIEAIRIRELSWCDIIKCSDNYKNRNVPLPSFKNHQKQEQPSFQSPTPGSIQNLEADLKRAVSNAMKDIIPDSGGSHGSNINNNIDENKSDIRKNSLSPKEIHDIKLAKQAALKLDTAKPITGTHEALVCNVLLKGAEILLNGYPTTLKEDLRWLGMVPSVDEDGWSYDSSSTTTATNVKSLLDHPRAYQAILLRIETKRILHSIVLENLNCLRNAHNISYYERKKELINELPIPLNVDLHTKKMEEKRNSIHNKMNKHFTYKMVQWDTLWKSWRKRIHLVWGGGNNPDPTKRDLLDKKFKRILEQNVHHIAAAIKKTTNAVIKQQQQHKKEELSSSPIDVSIEDQQMKDLETFAERTGESIVNL